MTTPIGLYINVLVHERRNFSALALTHRYVRVRVCVYADLLARAINKRSIWLSKNSTDIVNQLYIITS